MLFESYENYKSCIILPYQHFISLILKIHQFLFQIDKYYLKMTYRDTHSNSKPNRQSSPYVFNRRFNYWRASHFYDTRNNHEYFIRNGHLDIYYEPKYIHYIRKYLRGGPRHTKSAAQRPTTRKIWIHFSPATWMLFRAGNHDGMPENSWFDTSELRWQKRSECAKTPLKRTTFRFNYPLGVCVNK